MGATYTMDTRALILESLGSDLEWDSFWDPFWEWDKESAAW